MFTAQHNVSLMWRWGEPCSSTQTQRAVMIHLSLQGIVGDRLAADRLLPWDKSPSLPPSLLPGCLSPGQVTMPTSIGQSLLPPPSPPPSLSPGSTLRKGPFLVARNRTWTCHWFFYRSMMMITQSRPECRNAGPKKRYQNKLLLVVWNGVRRVIITHHYSRKATVLQCAAIHLWSKKESSETRGSMRCEGMGGGWSSFL